MRLLLDTQLVLWAAAGSNRLGAAARALIEDPANDLIFSAACIWEIAIKSALGRPDFHLDATRLRQQLLANFYSELAIDGAHAAAAAALPALHKDPFDRMLVAQAIHENLTLLTADAELARYPGPILLV
jgi:PIN domain nuclease of toxin-antitoxin system